ncbi:hypothetical protein EYF80_054106 [Liparis tanakae]|uniref:Uncharacterized protein n=1 Tax=Liparis tanakae TaxID=230148 RepID=A0A4Z2F3U5_9TELE|nr:hypothetical protein EYF80_054106 [Liparis tanakae]
MKKWKSWSRLNVTGSLGRFNLRRPRGFAFILITSHFSCANNAPRFQPHGGASRLHMQGASSDSPTSAAQRRQKRSSPASQEHGSE